MEERPLKFVISGPVGAGKTTFVKTLSESPVISTDEAATEDIGKANTTVAMDFGTITLDGIPIHLYGTPGQDRFDFMLEILSEGAIGLLLLLSGERPADFMRARAIIHTITSRLPVPYLIGVTHLDSPEAWTPAGVADFFQIERHCVTGLDAREQADCLETLLQVLELAADSLEASTIP